MLIDMGMRVDQAGQHQLPRAIDDVGAVGGEPFTEGDDALAHHRDVADRIESRRRIDDASALQEN